MQRIFTVDVGRFQKGVVRDYPRQTWEQIAKSSDKKLGNITTCAESAAKHHIKRGGKQ